MFLDLGNVKTLMLSANKARARSWPHSQVAMSSVTEIAHGDTNMEAHEKRAEVSKFVHTGRRATPSRMFAA